MSFGFGVGDFLAVGNLAWNVYRSCKNMTEEFQEVCREALTVHTLIKELQDEAADPCSTLNLRGPPRKQELILLLKNLEGALKELDEIVGKYQSLSRRERRIWNQLRLATEDLASVRSKPTFHITAINTFISTLSRGTLVQIETVLLDLVSEIRQGRPQPSLASLHDNDADDVSVWKELESELARDGISSADVARNKIAIKIFVQGLLGDSDDRTVSFVEVASFVKAGNDDIDSRCLSHNLNTMDLSCEDPAASLFTANSENGSLASTDSEEYESADEELPLRQGSAFNTTIPPRSETIGFNDALEYLDLIKVKFEYPSNNYERFLAIMEGYKERVIDLADVIEWVSALFVCYPDLLDRFVTFLPPGIHIECGLVDKHFAFRVIKPDTAYIRIPNLEAMESLAVKGQNLHIGLLKWIDPASLDILRPYPTTDAGSATAQPASPVPAAVKARKTAPGRLKTIFARLKVTKEKGTDIARSREEKTLSISVIA